MTARQKRMKRARSKAWSPAARAKRRATWAAKRAGSLPRGRGSRVVAPDATGEAPSGRPRGGRGAAGPVTEAIALLEMAEAAIMRRGNGVTRGRRNNRHFNVSDTYAMLALATLRGEV